MIATSRAIAVLGALTLGSALVPTATEAATLPIVGGETTVTVTADLAGLGLSGAPFGTASVEVIDGLPVFGFPITGGSLDETTGTALIEHDGSGVTLAALSDPTVDVTVGNFLIDTEDATISGDVIGGPEDLALFEFGTIDETGIQLLIAEDLAGALTDVFGAPDLEGAEFGLATTGPQVVPLPAAGWLLATVVAGLGLMRRRAA